VATNSRSGHRGAGRRDRGGDPLGRRAGRGWVGFTSVLSTYALLGFAGCLQFFTATFYGDLEELELTVNSLYAGT
jgi:hypothetical protein